MFKLNVASVMVLDQVRVPGEQRGNVAQAVTA
jgi:hypothetical protein